MQHSKHNKKKTQNLYQKKEQHLTIVLLSKKNERKLTILHESKS